MPASNLVQSDISAPWWEEKTKSKVQPKVQRLFSYYATNSRGRLDTYTAHSALYTNRDVFGNDHLKAFTAAFDQSEYSRVPLNVIKVMVDAVHARLTRPAIAVEFLPAGGNWSLRTKSRQMGQFVRQQQHQCSLRSKEDSAVLDSQIYGIGAVKTSPHPKVAEIENHRVCPWDIFVDPVEADANEKVSHLYQRAYVARGRLKKLFPAHAKKIEDAGRLSVERNGDWAEEGSDTPTTPTGNLVELIEGWKLPSWPGAGDGKHVLFIDGAVLDYSDWENDDFPFSFTYWKKDPTVGFWGISQVEELLGLHFDINTSILHTEKAIEIMPKPYLLAPADGEINEGQLGNGAGIIINYTGRAPQLVLPQSVPLDVVQYTNQQWQRALQVSRLVAMGLPEKAGNAAETGQAFKDIVDIQSTELAPNFKFREDFCIRLAEQQIVAGKQLDLREKAEGRGGFKTVLRKDRNTVEAVDWASFDLDPRKDSYVVQAQPTSALSQTFGGRLSEVKELVGLGAIPMSRAFKLLDIPDLDGEMRIQNAPLDAIEKAMELILDEGELIEPEPTTDLRLALKVSQGYINLAQAMGVEDERINMLYQYLSSVTTLIEEEQRATQVQAAGLRPEMPGMPPAVDITGASPGAAALSGSVMGQI